MDSLWKKSRLIVLAMDLIALLLVFSCLKVENIFSSSLRSLRRVGPYLVLDKCSESCEYAML